MPKLIDYPDGKNPYTGEKETWPALVTSENTDDGTISAVAFDFTGASHVVTFLPDDVREKREADAKAKADADAKAEADAEAQREQDAADLAEFRRERAERDAQTKSNIPKPGPNNTNAGGSQ